VKESVEELDILARACESAVGFAGGVTGA